MGNRGYVQQVYIPEEAPPQTIIDLVNEAFKPVYRTNILPFFPQWYLLRVVTQFYPNGDAKKGVPCMLVATDSIDYLTLTRYPFTTVLFQTHIDPP
jgi:hypothetical protein